MFDKLKSKLTPGIRPLPPGTTMRDKNILLATWFGAGRLKPASGTWGSIAAIPPGYLIYAIGGIPALALAAALFLWIGTVTGDYYGKKSGVSDDQAIVIDEVVGMWIAALPCDNEPILWLVALLLFRIFDITKPWPASFYDKRSGGGYDVMMDDVVAGVYAMLGVAGIAIPFLLRK